VRDLQVIVINDIYHKLSGAAIIADQDGIIIVPIGEGLLALHEVCELGFAFARHVESDLVGFSIG
jgi:hypothetical protein